MISLYSFTGLSLKWAKAKYQKQSKGELYMQLLPCWHEAGDKGGLRVLIP